MKIKHRRDGLWGGEPCYLVMRGDAVLGRVYRRPGGWWGWQVEERGGSWEPTRLEATRRVVKESTAASE